MQYTYFPLTLDQLGAEVRYHDLVEGTFGIGGIEVRTQYLNHTALTLGYRLEGDGVCLVYATDHEPYLDRLTRLAAALFKVPIALTSLVDQDRQWYKSCQGTTTIETSREVSLCAHAILSCEVTVVPDTLLDVRFADNPLVTGEPHIRFYAGYPIRVFGQPVGTLCIVDTRPHQIDDAGIRCLEDLGFLAQQELTIASRPT